MIVPGTSVYTIEQVPPTQKRPYVTYKPAMRIVTAVQGDGTGEVALVLAYNPKFEIADNLFDKKKQIFRAKRNRKKASVFISSFCFIDVYHCFSFS